VKKHDNEFMKYCLSTSGERKSEQLKIEDCIQKGKPVPPDLWQRFKSIQDKQLEGWHCARHERHKQDMDRDSAAKKGGHASARYKDDAILEALRRHKHEPGNADHTMTSAITALINNGTLNYSDTDKVIKRLSSIGKRMEPPKRPKDIYASL